MQRSVFFSIPGLLTEPKSVAGQECCPARLQSKPAHYDVWNIACNHPRFQTGAVDVE